MVSDLRDKAGVRAISERILSRAEFLDPADRALLEQVLERGVPPWQVAVLSGTFTRTVQRRVRNLMRRLTDPAVVCVLRSHRDWDRPLGAVALGIWVRGWTLRQTAGRLGLSLHRVRQHVQTIRGRIDAAEAKSKAGARYPASETSQ